MTVRARVPALLAALACAALFAAGCFSPSPAHVERWREEAAAHGPMGLSAEFDLTGSPFFVTGAGRVDTLDAPLWIVPSLPGWTGTPPYVYFATTLPGAGAGVLRVEGAQVRALAGTLGAIEVTRVEGQATSLRLLPATDIGHVKPTINWTEAQFNVSSDLFHARGVAVEGRGLQIDSFDRAVFYDAAGRETNLTSPLTIDTTALYLLPESLIVLQERTINASYAQFAWAAQATAGTLTTEREVGLPRPTGVFGNDARLAMTPGRVHSDGSFRLTQAIGPNGPLLDAEVELYRAAPGAVNVTQGGSAWVAVDYREKGYEGAAVSKGVRVTGTGRELVEVRMERPPLLIEEMFDLIPASATWARPIVAAFVVLSAPAIIWLDIVNEVACFFSTCPERHPYPVWMEPGEIGTFYIELKGDAPPGPYQAVVTFQGTNHDDESIPLDFVIVAAPPSTGP